MMHLFQSLFLLDDYFYIETLNKTKVALIFQFQSLFLLDDYFYIENGWIDVKIFLSFNPYFYWMIIFI